jgi:hypothetical protein
MSDNLACFEWVCGVLFGYVAICINLLRNSTDERKSDQYKSLCHMAIHRKPESYLDNQQGVPTWLESNLHPKNQATKQHDF